MTASKQCVSERTAQIRAEKLTRTYQLGSRQITALNNIDLEIESGSVVAVRGRSGSGKTTLLNCLSGLDRPTSGQVWVNGQEVTKLGEQGRVLLRRNHIGFIFQSHALMPIYSAAENIDLMLRLAGWSRSERTKRTVEVLTQVGLANWIDHRPYEMSGGQQQRVSIARAIAAKPSIIFADEPTGELDVKTGEEILSLFQGIAKENNTSILIATHDLVVDEYADRVIYLRDGVISDSV
ncbi:MAG: ABC transporter ATP-binding protein [Anaerolineae bacterium]